MSARPRVILVLGAFALVYMGCVRDHDVSVVLSPHEDGTDAVTYGLQVLRMEECPAMEPLLDGAYERFLAHTQVFTPEDAEPVGELEPGRYAFVAMGRTASCHPASYGCQLVEIGRDDRVVIELRPVESDDFLCPEAHECEDGICFEVEGSGDREPGEEG